MYKYVCLCMCVCVCGCVGWCVGVYGCGGGMRAYVSVSWCVACALRTRSMMRPGVATTAPHVNPMNSITMGCGMWYGVVCGVRCVRCVVCGVWCVVCAVWCGVWCVLFDVNRPCLSY